jgi:O-antigen/teichoic acid export membrane protein
MMSDQTLREQASSGTASGAEAPETKPPPRRSLTRQTAVIFVGGLVAQASWIVLLSGLTRLVSKGQLGAYQQLALLYGIVSPLLVAGIPAALLYFIPRSKDRNETRSWVATAYIVLGTLGLLFSLAIALARVPIAHALGNAQLSPILLVYSPYPGLAFLASVLPSTLVALGRAALATLVGVTGSILTVICALSGVAVAPDAKHIAAGLVVGQLGFTVLSVITVCRVVGVTVPWRTLAARSAALLKFGVPLALTGLAGMIAFQFDRLVVSRDFSAALYAVYSVGAVELPISVLVQQSVNSTLMPALTRHFVAGDVPGMAALWRRAVRRTSLVLLPTFVFFMLTAPAAVRLLFGASYSESTVMFRIYLFLVPLRVATYGLMTQAIGRTGINLTGALMFLASNAVLVLLLVGPLGLPGPAVATVSATAGLAGYYLVRLRRVLGLTIRALFPWGVLAANFAVSVAAALPAALLVLLGVHGLVQLPIVGVIYPPCYLGLMLLTRRLDDTELQALHRVVRGGAAAARATLRHRSVPAA